MNVDIFKSDPDVKYYFASALPMMFVVLGGWYLIKHFLARRRQTPYQRGIYEHLFFELATTYPRLWSRSVRILGAHISSFESTIRYRDICWQCTLSRRIPKLGISL